MNSPNTTTGRRGRLRDRLVTLAGTPDDSATVATDLIIIAQLAADLTGEVNYASVTGSHQENFTTVAASSDLAVAVDQAQYADHAGPCLRALTDGRPVPVPEISATMTWPGFRQVAIELGLRASLSIPLFAGRGTPLAALNLYGRRAGPMHALSAAVLSVYEGGSPDPGTPLDLDAGGQELVAGLAGALAVRTIIQQALGVIVSTAGGGPQQAYATLRARAAEESIPLVDMAGRLTSGRRW